MNNYKINREFEYYFSYTLNHFLDNIEKSIKLLEKSKYILNTFNIVFIVNIITAINIFITSKSKVIKDFEDEGEYRPYKLIIDTIDYENYEIKLKHDACDENYEFNYEHYNELLVKLLKAKEDKQNNYKTIRDNIKSYKPIKIDQYHEQIYNKQLSKK